MSFWFSLSTQKLHINDPSNKILYNKRKTYTATLSLVKGVIAQWIKRLLCNLCFDGPWFKSTSRHYVLYLCWCSVHVSRLGHARTPLCHDRFTSFHCPHRCITDLFFVRQLAEASFELGTIHSEQIWRKSTNVDALDRSAMIAA